MKIKSHLRSFVFNSGALWLAAFLIKGVEFSGDYKTILSAGLALTLANLFIKPLVKLLLLPVNILTVGAFRWVAGVAALYLATSVVSGFSISGFDFPGYMNNGLIVPSFQTGPFWAYVLVSFFISILVGFVYWLIK